MGNIMVPGIGLVDCSWCSSRRRPQGDLVRKPNYSIPSDQSTTPGFVPTNAAASGGTTSSGGTSLSEGSAPRPAPPPPVIRRKDSVEEPSPEDEEESEGEVSSEEESGGESVTYSEALRRQIKGYQKKLRSTFEVPAGMFTKKCKCALASHGKTLVWLDAKGGKVVGSFDMAHVERSTINPGKEESVTIVLGAMGGDKGSQVFIFQNRKEREAWQTAFDQCVKLLKESGSHVN